MPTLPKQEKFQLTEKQKKDFIEKYTDAPTFSKSNLEIFKKIMLLLSDEAWESIVLAALVHDQRLPGKPLFGYQTGEEGQELYYDQYTETITVTAQGMKTLTKAQKSAGDSAFASIGMSHEMTHQIMHYFANPKNATAVKMIKDKYAEECRLGLDDKFINIFIGDVDTTKLMQEKYKSYINCLNVAKSELEMVNNATGTRKEKIEDLVSDLRNSTIWSYYEIQALAQNANFLNSNDFKKLPPKKQKSIKDNIIAHRVVSAELGRMKSYEAEYMGHVKNIKKEYTFDPTNWMIGEFVSTAGTELSVKALNTLEKNYGKGKPETQLGNVIHNARASYIIRANSSNIVGTGQYYNFLVNEDKIRANVHYKPKDLETKLQAEQCVNKYISNLPNKLKDTFSTKALAPKIVVLGYDAMPNDYFDAKYDPAKNEILISGVGCFDDSGSVKKPLEKAMKDYRIYTIANLYTWDVSYQKEFSEQIKNYETILSRAVSIYEEHQKLPQAKRELTSTKNKYFKSINSIALNLYGIKDETKVLNLLKSELNKTENFFKSGKVVNKEGLEILLNIFPTNLLSELEGLHDNTGGFFDSLFRENDTKTINNLASKIDEDANSMLLELKTEKMKLILNSCSRKVFWDMRLILSIMSEEDFNILYKKALQNGEVNTKQPILFETGEEKITYNGKNTSINDIINKRLERNPDEQQYLALQKKIDERLGRGDKIELRSSDIPTLRREEYNKIYSSFNPSIFSNHVIHSFINQIVKENRIGEFIRYIDANENSEFVFNSNKDIFTLEDGEKKSIVYIPKQQNAETGKKQDIQKAYTSLARNPEIMNNSCLNSTDPTECKTDFIENQIKALGATEEDIKENEACTNVTANNPAINSKLADILNCFENLLNITIVTQDNNVCTFWHLDPQEGNIYKSTYNTSKVDINPALQRLSKEELELSYSLNPESSFRANIEKLIFSTEDLSSMKSNTTESNNYNGFLKSFDNSSLKPEKSSETKSFDHNSFAPKNLGIQENVTYVPALNQNIPTESNYISNQAYNAFEGFKQSVVDAVSRNLNPLYLSLNFIKNQDTKLILESIMTAMMQVSAQEFSLYGYSNVLKSVTEKVLFQIRTNGNIEVAIEKYRKENGIDFSAVNPEILKDDPDFEININRQIEESIRQKCREQANDIIDAINTFALLPAGLGGALGTLVGREVMGTDLCFSPFQSMQNGVANAYQNLSSEEKAEFEKAVDKINTVANSLNPFIENSQNDNKEEKLSFLNALQLLEVTAIKSAFKAIAGIYYHNESESKSHKKPYPIKEPNALSL